MDQPDEKLDALNITLHELLNKEKVTTIGKDEYDQLLRKVTELIRKFDELLREPLNAKEQLAFHRLLTRLADLAETFTLAYNQQQEFNRQQVRINSELSAIVAKLAERNC